MFTFAVAGALALVNIGASKKGTASSPAIKPDVLTLDFKVIGVPLMKWISHLRDLLFTLAMELSLRGVKK